MQLELLDRHAVGILVLARWAFPNGTPTEGGDTLQEQSSIIGVAKDRTSKRAHEAHFVGHTDIGTRSAERREIGDDGVAAPKHTFIGAADCQGSLAERQGWIKGVLLVAWESSNQPIPLADGALVRADLARVRQEHRERGCVAVLLLTG